SRELKRLDGREMYRLDVLPVDAEGAHSVGGCTMGQVPNRLVLRLRRGLRPMVVLANEDDRQLPELSEVHRLVERPDVRRTVTEERERDARLLAHLECEGCTHSGRQAATDNG